MRPAMQRPDHKAIDAIQRLRDMPVTADWCDKFYAAVEAMEFVVDGYVTARPEPPHQLMARLIEDVAWVTRPEHPW